MFNIFLILFVFAELSFYLLIAQTGIVEVFHSDIFSIIYLPVGGIIGTYFSVYIPFKIEQKAIVLLSLQIFTTLFYPEFNPALLFLLGLSVGGISPIIIQTLKKATIVDLGISLGLSYGFSTLLFNTNPMSREILGLSLSLVAILGYIFLQRKKITSEMLMFSKFHSYPLYLMVIWVFLDSSLFETLSRDDMMAIWRGGYSTEIILFHLLGVAVAIGIRVDKSLKALFISLLFITSYLFYFMHEALLLSIVYPFVISYYNVVILQSLIKVKSLKDISLFMVLIGWMASGAGLMFALQGLTQYNPIIIFILISYGIIKKLNFKKELSHV